MVAPAKTPAAQVPPPTAEPVRTEVIASAAGSIDNSRWANRLLYVHWTTLGLLGILAWAVHIKNGHAVTVVGGLFVTNAILAVVTPSAEQISKMLAQVAAIRFGVGSPPKDTP